MDGKYMPTLLEMSGRAFTGNTDWIHTGSTPSIYFLLILYLLSMIFRNPVLG